MDFTYLINIEKTVLSTILYNNDEIYYISNVLNPSDFYSLIHQETYKIMLELHNEEMPIDEDFIIKRANSKNLSEFSLLEILSANPITNAEAYCYEIKESSKVRKIQALSNEISNLINSEEKSNDILFSLHKKIEAIESDYDLPVKTTPVLIKEVIQDMEKANLHGNKILGQTSGLKALDNIIGAFEDGDLIIIAARPSMGKTSVISTLTIQSLLDNNGVLIESLEMPSKKIMMRLLAAKSGESLTDLKKGLTSNKNIFDEAIKFFENSNIIISDKSYPTLTELQSRIKTSLRKNPTIKNIFIDHTGKIQLLGRTREDIEIGHISAILKKIAKDYNIRVFLLQQLNRGVEARDNKRPMLSDIKNSGNIEEDADIVLGLYRHSYYQKESKNTLYNNQHIEDAEIIVLKNRDGQTSTAKVSFEGRSARFINKQYPESIEIEFE